MGEEEDEVGVDGGLGVWNDSELDEDWVGENILICV